MQSNPAIKEIDINPLLASPDRLLALDARVVLQDPAKTKDELPKPAIRPYPSQYVSDWTLKDGAVVKIRPIRPEDEPLMVDFHRTLSDRTVYLRYFASLSLSARTAHERLLRICFGDYEREMVLVVERHDSSSRKPKIVAVGRLNKLRGRNEAELAVLIADQLQNHGLGCELLTRLVQVARDEKLSKLRLEMLYDNVAMQVISKRVGFQLHKHYDSGSVSAVMEL